jgi:hypothetical protein
MKTFESPSAIVKTTGVAVMLSRWLSRLALAAGLGVLVVTGIFVSLNLHSVEPLDGNYGGQAMLAFELAESPSDLARVIGPNPPTVNAISIRRAMDHANHLDFLYMALYATFIAFSCAHLALAKKRNWLLIAAILGPVAACFDVAENLALLSLTRSDAAVPALLASLHVRTFGKWELLALTSAMFAAGFVGNRRRWITLIAILVSLVAVASGILTYANPPRYSAVLAYWIAAVWLWQVVYAAVAVSRFRTLA